MCEIKIRKDEQQIALEHEWARKLDLYREANKQIQTEQVVFAGSSLMEMFPTEEFQAYIGDSPRIYNRGIGGFTTTEMLKVLDVCIYDLYPSKIFMNIGTNDLSNAKLALSDIMENYATILANVKQHLPSATLYLLAYYPINYPAAKDYMKECLKIRTNEKINAANLLVADLAKQTGSHYLDLNDTLKDADQNLKEEFTIEGMHIKPEGYRTMFDRLAYYVNL